MKNVLITGASGGIGGACARLFAEKGFRVAMNYYHNDAAAATLKNELNALDYCVKAFKCDVSDEKSVSEMFESIKKLWGNIDVLVCSSGIAQQKLFTDISGDEWDKIFDVNVKGTFLCSKYAVKQMLASHSGSIITVSSMWGQTGASCEVHYSASKAAIIGMTKALAKETGPSGIRVNCICPGVIDTKMNANLDEKTFSALKEETPLERIGTPEDVANAALFLAQNTSSFITGQVLGVNGGLVI